MPACNGLSVLPIGVSGVTIAFERSSRVGALFCFGLRASFYEDAHVQAASRDEGHEFRSAHSACRHGIAHVGPVPVAGRRNQQMRRGPVGSKQTANRLYERFKGLLASNADDGHFDER